MLERPLASGFRKLARQRACPARKMYLQILFRRGRGSRGASKLCPAVSFLITRSAIFVTQAGLGAPSWGGAARGHNTQVAASSAVTTVRSALSVWGSDHISSVPPGAIGSPFAVSPCPQGSPRLVFEPSLWERVRAGRRRGRTHSSGPTPSGVPDFSMGSAPWMRCSTILSLAKAVHRPGSSGRHSDSANCSGRRGSWWGPGKTRHDRHPLPTYCSGPCSAASFGVAS